MLNLSTPHRLCWTVFMLGYFCQSAPVMGGEEGRSEIGSAVVALSREVCLDCHSGGAGATAGFDMELLLERPLAERREAWERVVKKLVTGQMPPADSTAVDRQTVLLVARELADQLDALYRLAPQVGRTPTFRRLTRYEYRAAIRDLLALEVDVDSLLPRDESSHGFDNITVSDLSPTLVGRYITAAEKIARWAVGTNATTVEGRTVRIRPDVTQEEHVEGLPLGTRGGTLIQHLFPQSGYYDFEMRLARDRNEHVEGLHEPHELELAIDLQRIELFTVRPPRGSRSGDPYDQVTHENVDRHLRARVFVEAGPHEVAVAFLKKPSSLLETARQPLNVHFNMYRHPRLNPALFEVSITGPFAAAGPGQTPSRQRIFSCRPSGEEEEEVDCARRILGDLMRRAYRRPVTAEDFVTPMALFQQARESGNFDDGIELALSSILVSPHFLFRIERDPPHVPAGQVYPISPLELASRLSFFLWSSLPDERLLGLAESGRLTQPQVLEAEVRRMLVDPRSEALVENFAGQWLYLRNLESMTPDARLYPDFDDNLRQAMRRETELCFADILRNDLSVVRLLQSDYTFLNERLARHYGIPGVLGSRFRKVRLPSGSHRGGLLRHASILTVTSYADRTSPVIRGKWVLENILGSPPPPPPPNIPALEDTVISASLPIRQRLEAHRADPSCAACHDMIDPVGFALENFDAVGRWREFEGDQPVDASGGLPDGSRFVGVEALEQGLLRYPEIFVTTVAEKLFTYGLGRGCAPADAPAIRQAVRRAAAHDYRLSELIVGLVQSPPFHMRTAAGASGAEDYD
ncbi:MAG: hypothetical protein KatS3mg111_3228 [Pirellulaceae bacterium]|nr:MAG: hypothetical protein KatS3mg111_3228 [Pirellulaceae bacterium]